MQASRDCVLGEAFCDGACHHVRLDLQHLLQVQPWRLTQQSNTTLPKQRAAVLQAKSFTSPASRQLTNGPPVELQRSLSTGAQPKTGLQLLTCCTEWRGRPGCAPCSPRRRRQWRGWEACPPARGPYWRPGARTGSAAARASRCPPQSAASASSLTRTSAAPAPPRTPPSPNHSSQLQYWNFQQSSAIVLSMSFCDGPFNLQAARRRSSPLFCFKVRHFPMKTLRE